MSIVCMHLHPVWKHDYSVHRAWSSCPFNEIHSSDHRGKRHIAPGRPAMATVPPRIWVVVMGINFQRQLIKRQGAIAQRLDDTITGFDSHIFFLCSYRLAFAAGTPFERLPGKTGYRFLHAGAKGFRIIHVHFLPKLAIIGYNSESAGIASQE